MSAENLTKVSLSILAICAAVALIGCGKTSADVNPVVSVEMCSVQPTNTGAIISCPDGSTSIINNGSNGKDGKDGNSAPSCSVTQNDNGMTVKCPDGTSATVYNGSSCSTKTTDYGALISCSDGSVTSVYNGKDGIAGASGKDGESCSVSSLEDGSGSLIKCGSSSAFLSNGKDGSSAVLVDQVVDPCPGTHGSFSGVGEKIIKLASGEFFGMYREYLSVLPENRILATQDGRDCRFKIQNGQIEIMQNHNHEYYDSKREY